MADTKRKPLTTDLALKNAKCAEGKRSTRYSCGGLGLYLDVKSGGARSFMLCVMVQGKRIERGLGSYPQVTLEQAREKAIIFTRRLREGEDVGAKVAKAATSKCVTFRQAAESYLELQDGEGNYKPALNGDQSVHRKQWDYSLDTFVIPKIGDMDVNQIRISDLTAIFQPIWKTKYATALKTRQRVALVLDHCVDMGWRDENLANPARHKSPAFKRPKNLETKNHAAMDVADMPGFMAELRKLDSVSALALEFTILTGVRTSETRAAKWGEIEGNMWVIPAERMKANKPHRVPLSDAALAVLGKLRLLQGQEGWVFPGKIGKRDEGCLSNMAQLGCLKGLRPDVTVHGFRSTFRAWAIGAGVVDEVRAACSAHTRKDKVQAAYERGDFFAQRVPVMQAWADYLA